MSKMIYQNYVDLNKLYDIMAAFGVILGVLVLLSLMVRNGFRLRMPKQLSRMQVKLRLEVDKIIDGLFSANMTCSGNIEVIRI